MGYKIITNNGDICRHTTFIGIKKFVKWVSAQRFIKVYKYTVDKNGNIRTDFPVYIATASISEISKWQGGINENVR